jgi:hypothetical protein
MEEQLQQAKKVIREFVVEMRGGRRMMVLTPAGQLKATTCSLDKRLSVLRIVRNGKIRRVPLGSILAIHPGVEAPEGLRTPLDDLCATVAVGPDASLITFRFEHINARDTFVMCTLLFAQALQGGEEEGELEEEYDENADDEIAFAAAAALGQMMYNLDNSYEESLPENQFLKKFNLVNDDLSLVDQEGHRIDVDGTLVNDKGWLVNDSGNRIDREGNLLSEAGQMLLQADYEDDVHPAPPKKKTTKKSSPKNNTD